MNRASVEIHERRVDVGGVSTHYLTAGAGPAMVLLHGDGESAVDWRRAIPDFARTHRVLAPSLPGHGNTGRWDGDHSPEFFVRFLRNFLAAVGGEDRTVVVGNSLGGAIAVRYAATYPTGRPPPRRNRCSARLESAGSSDRRNRSLRAASSREPPAAPEAALDAAGSASYDHHPSVLHVRGAKSCARSDHRPAARKRPSCSGFAAHPPRTEPLKTTGPPDFPPGDPNNACHARPAARALDPPYETVTFQCASFLCDGPRCNFGCVAIRRFKRTYGRTVL